MNNTKFINESVEMLKEQLTKLADESTVLSNLSFDNEETVVMERLVGYFDVIKWCLSMIEELNKHIPLNEIYAEELNEFFEEFEKAVQSKDLVTIGDVLEFELKPLFLDWGNKLNTKRV